MAKPDHTHTTPDIDFTGPYTYIKKRNSGSSIFGTPQWNRWQSHKQLSNMQIVKVLQFTKSSWSSFDASIQYESIEEESFHHRCEFLMYLLLKSELVPNL